MAPKQRAMRALTPLISDTTICLSCRRQILSQQRRPQPTSTRTYASAAAAVADSPSPASSHLHSPPIPSAGPKPIYALRAGIQLSRAPTLTRPLHPFEKAFFLYQKRLNERLALPFTQYFYFKKGTPANVEWKRKMKDRRTPARDIGAYTAYGRMGWNDEVVLGSEDARFAEEEVVRERLVRDVQGEGPELLKEAVSEDVVAVETGEEADEGQGKAKADEEVELAAQAAARRRAQEVEKPMARVTEADKKGDQRSLDRLGWRTLYLLVKAGGEKGKWMFPTSRVEGRESLRTAAERVIIQAGGINMNTWVVGNAPVSHYANNYRAAIDNAESGTKELGEKVFLLKGRIMAGQADLSDNKLGLSEFKWLAKEEIKEHVERSYWNQIENSLAER